MDKRTNIEYSAIYLTGDSILLLCHQYVSEMRIISTLPISSLVQANVFHAPKRPSLEIKKPEQATSAVLGS
jgi:hypothetical protein